MENAGKFLFGAGSVSFQRDFQLLLFRVDSHQSESESTLDIPQFFLHPIRLIKHQPPLSARSNPKDAF